MEIILDILYLYIALYSVLFLIMSVRNIDNSRFKFESRYNETNIKNNLCLVLYSHNNRQGLEKIAKLLRLQDYGQENFVTYAICDNCTDGSEEFLATEPLIQTFGIKNVDTIGKDQSISILLEKLLPATNLDAYVFMDADRFIENDFLTSINSALMYSPVITGSTVLVAEKMNLRRKIKSVYHKYYTNFLLKSRSLLGFANIIDSRILVIRKDLVEKVGSVDFQNINTELKFSLLLTKIGCKCVFDPNIKTYIGLDEFRLRLPSLSKRLGLFANCVTKFDFKNFAFNEQACSLLYPNVWVLLILYAGILKHSYKYYFFVDFAVVLTTFIILVLGFSISLLSSKIHSSDFAFLFMYPIYSLIHIIKNFPPIRFFRKHFGRKLLPRNTRRMRIDAMVTDGKINIPCTLDLISQNGLARVRFTYKKKKFQTQNHLRMVDATRELAAKLNDYGFVLRICQCCEHFTPNIDGSTNMVKGFCSFRFANMVQNDGIPTFLWNTCDAFNPQLAQSIIEEISNSK